MSVSRYGCIKRVLAAAVRQCVHMHHAVQVAECFRLLGRSSRRGPHELAHAARMAGCILAIMKHLAPLGGAAQPAPRVQDVELVEALLQSGALLELTTAIQRLVPQHTDGVKGACSCCRPGAPAWSHRVPYLGQGPNPPEASVAEAVGEQLCRHLGLLARVNMWLESAAATSSRSSRWQRSWSRISAGAGAAAAPQLCQACHLQHL